LKIKIFLGIDSEEEYLKISKKRKLEIENENIQKEYKERISGFRNEKELSNYLVREMNVEYGTELNL
jgi:site-specific DNA-methyltransferase (adenine-specific)